VSFLFISLLGSCSNQNQIEYYENGQVKSSYNIINGAIEGESKIYYPNGKIKTIAHFKNGKQDGKTQFYYENGNLERDVFFKEGIQEDTMKLYFSNGSLQEICVIHKGKKNGLFKNFYNNGELKSIGYLCNDKLYGEWLSYDSLGKFLKKENYINSLLIYLIRYENESIRFNYPMDWLIIKNYKGTGAIAIFDTLDNDFNENLPQYKLYY
jgi:hypothetical protein